MFFRCLDGAFYRLTFSSLFYLTSSAVYAFLPPPVCTLHLNVCGCNLLGLLNKASSVDSGIKCGCLQMYGTCWRVSGAAERMCPVWQDPQIYGVDVTLHLWDRHEKISLFPFFFFAFLTNTLPALKVPLRSHSFSFLAPYCRLCPSAGQAVGLYVKRRKQQCGFECVTKAEGVLVEPVRPLCNMSDQSSMEIGDPLGDRFWLSPKKGKWS